MVCLLLQTVLLESFIVSEAGIYSRHQIKRAHRNLSVVRPGTGSVKPGLDCAASISVDREVRIQGQYFV
jgi:hypothetical protein